MRQETQKKKKWPWLILLILSLALLAFGGYKLWEHFHEDPFDPKQFHNTDATVPSTVPTLAPETETNPSAETEVVTEPLEISTEEPETTSDEPQLRDNPIDFAELQAVNPDAYAWIYIPMGDDLDIDYPLFQARPGDDDNYYLHHNIYRKYQFSGCIYTQRWNTKDFTDRVTVVYGHNMLNGTMFTNLVYFLKNDFFQEHDVFYIYMPGHILTYRIASAIQFDDRHLLNCFDFSDDGVYQDWINNYIVNPKSVNRAYREDITVTTEDKLVILSTCLEHGKYRLLVQGVLIDDEPTN